MRREYYGGRKFIDLLKASGYLGRDAYATIHGDRLFLNDSWRSRPAGRSSKDSKEGVGEDLQTAYLGEE